MEILDIEGWNNQFGWHLYLAYGKVLNNKDFLNCVIRRPIYKVWESHRWLLEPKTPWWVSPSEVIGIKKLNMGKVWPTYHELVTKEQGIL